MHPIHLNIIGEPAYLMLRDGDLDWMEPIPDPEGGYSSCVGEDFVVVAVCTFLDGDFSAQQFAATHADGDHLDLAPCNYPPGQLPVVTISGELKQAGMVFVDGTGQASGPGRPFALPVFAGTHDLVASDDYRELNTSPGHVLLRRGQRFDASQSGA